MQARFYSKAFMLLVLLLLCVANVSFAQDYTITITGGNLIITDVSSNGETLTMAQDGTNVRFTNSNTARTYSINGGPTTTFATPADVALAGLNSITINAAAGNDNINIGAFTTALPSLTINGGTGNDVVNMNGDITFAANANLDIDLQNDAPTPGTDRVVFAANAKVLLSGTGTATIKVSRDVVFNTGSSLETVNGNLTIEANQQTTATAGDFNGVLVQGATVRATGTGVVTVKGKGGTGAANQYGGVNVTAAGVISGGTIGNSTFVQGTGGASTGIYNIGVWITGANSRITSSGGNVSVTGTGGGTGTSATNYGVWVDSQGTITADGSGTVSVTGTGGAATGTFNVGVWISGINSRITSSGGNVSVTGIGGGTGASANNYGVSVGTAGTITAGGSGIVTVIGVGGASTGANNHGVWISGGASRITSSGGNVSVNGTGGNGVNSVGLLNATANGITTATNGGDIFINANSVRLDATITAAGTNSLYISPFTPGVAINLGTTADPTAGPLGLSAAELNLITAGTLFIGNSNTGNITVSANITRTTPINTLLFSGGDIITSGGNLNVGGTLLLSPGTTNTYAIRPEQAGTDFAGSTVTFNSGKDLLIRINGTTVDTQYDRLSVTGNVNLSGANLRLTGTHTPVAGQVFTIVSATGTRSGFFNGLGNGAFINNFLGSNLTAQINYTANAVTLTVLLTPDYTITNTGSSLIITDAKGNGETLTMQQSGSNVRFTNSNTARTYSINGGPTTTFATIPSFALAGLNSITINAGAGNDNINIGAFTTNLPSLTINGGTGDDVVNMNGNINFAANRILDIDLQDDDATPGTDRVVFAANAKVLLSGTGTATIKVSRDVLFNIGSRLETVNGNLTIEANQQPTATAGNFNGVRVDGATVQATGTWVVTVKGKGGSLSNGNQYGVRVFAGGVISGGTTGNSTFVQGTGGASTFNTNIGVWIEGINSRITSSGGNVTVTGAGGGTGASQFNYGVSVGNAGTITAGGSGIVTVIGVGGGASTGANNYGVWISGANSRITSSGGNVSVTGIGGSGANSVGLFNATANGITTATNGGDIFINANSVRLDAAITAGTNSLYISPFTPGVAINLGTTADPTAGPLGLSAAELNLITAGTLFIGGSNAGNITVSANITRTTPINTLLFSGGDIITSGGNLNVGGTLLLSPGTTNTYAIRPEQAGTDFAGSTVTFNSGKDLRIRINGTTVDTQYDRLSVTGNVNLSGANLRLTGTHTPATGEVFTIVSATGTRSGFFNGLGNGATIPNFLGSNLTAQINYTANAVTLTVLPNSMSMSVLAPPSELDMSSQPVLTDSVFNTAGAIINPQMGLQNGQMAAAALSGTTERSVERGQLQDYRSEGRNGFKVYPNPSNGVYTLQGRQAVDGDAEVIITDMQGRIISRQTISGRGMNETIDLSGTSSGIYLLQIRQADGKVWTERLVKE